MFPGSVMLASTNPEDWVHCIGAIGSSIVKIPKIPGGVVEGLIFFITCSGTIIGLLVLKIIRASVYKASIT